MDNAIEILKEQIELNNVLIKNLRSVHPESKSPKVVNEALSQAIQWGKSLASAEKEIERLKKGIDAFKEMRSFDSKEYGDTLAQYRKGIAQKALRIEELRKTIQIMAEEHQKELATLEAELEKILKNSKAENIYEFMKEALDTSIENTKQLQQENAKLKEEVESVRLDCYGEALKNKKLQQENSKLKGELEKERMKGLARLEGWNKANKEIIKLRKEKEKWSKFIHLDNKRN